MSWLTRKSVFDQFGATKHTEGASNGHKNLHGRVVVVAGEVDGAGPQGACRDQP